jgi:hypothetical protein
VNEVLLMNGGSYPSQVPLLDCHDRSSVKSQLGSVSDIKIEGSLMVGKATISESEEDTFIKIREGHITDHSIGYSVTKSIWIPEGESQIIEGKTFEGPLKVSTKWNLKELSICPIGADVFAKVRSEVNKIQIKQNKNKQKKEKKMSEEYRSFLESIGLREDATEKEALKFANDFKAPESKDTEKEVKEGILKDRKRISEISEICKQFAINDEIREGLISEGSDIDSARENIMNILVKKSKKNSPDFTAKTSGMVDDKERFHNAAVDSIMLRGGKSVKNPSEGSESLEGFSLKELCRESLRIAGRDTTGNILDITGRALTVSDMPSIFEDVSNKFLQEGFAKEETYESWVVEESAPDFKPINLPRIGGLDDLEEVQEDGEIKYGTTADGKEIIRIVTHAKIYPFSRKAIINDDLSALTRIPNLIGKAVKRKRADAVYSVLTANGNLNDGIPLFDSAHGNLLSPGTAISINSVDLAMNAMAMQKDDNGKLISLNQEFIIVPVALKSVAKVLMASQYDPSANVAMIPNPVSGAAQVISDPRLDIDSTTSWYLAAGRGETVVIYNLSGVSTPQIETRNGWSVSGIEFKVEADFGVGSVGHQGLYKNVGA